MTQLEIDNFLTGFKPSENSSDWYSAVATMRKQVIIKYNGINVVYVGNSWKIFVYWSR